MPYNLLFLFTDEQRADTMRAYGNPVIQTPNLNRLAAQSCIFREAYVTQPVCTPSRSSILTGLYPHSSGCTENNVPLADEVPCFPEMLPHGRYAAAYHGKWHLGDEIFAQHGFEEWRSIDDNYIGHYRPGRDRDARSSYHHFLIENGFAPANGHTFGRDEAARFPEPYSKPAFLAREASRFIREHRNAPFVLFVNFLEPHMPFFGPRDGQHAPGEVLLPANFDALPGEDQPLKARLFQRMYAAHGHSGLPLVTEADWRRMIANYWGLVSLIDTHVGTILAALDDCGLADRTIVVYTSDHGDMMGSHRLLAKCVMYEEAVRVPLLVRLPGQTRGRRITGPLSQIDLVPTLLDLMGYDVPETLEGASRRDVLEDGRPLDGEVFVEWNGPNNGFGDIVGRVSVTDDMRALASEEEIARAVRDPVRSAISPDGWKLNASPLGEHELYNLVDDPLETCNRVRDPALRPVVRSLTDSIRRWQDATGDRVQLPDP